MSQIDDVAADIVSRLKELPGPREGATAMAIAHAHLCADGGGETEAQVRNMLRDSERATLQAWSLLTATPLKS